MKRITILLILSAGLLAAVACGVDATPTPTPTKGPGAQTPTATPTPTPSPPREWNLERIQVDDSTVTVLLHVFAGIDVRVTLDGRNSDELNAPIPTLEFVFKNVPPGKHTVEIRDVVGFSETAEVVVPPPVSAKEPTDGLCIPAAPLGVSVGDTWTNAGPVAITGPFPGEIPQGAAEWSATYKVTAIEDSTLGIGGRPTEPVEYQKVQAHATVVWKDANGNVLSAEEEDLSGVTVSVGNQGPVLTLDWDCHRAAWLESWQSPNKATVEEQTLSSGITAVVFSVVQVVEVPAQGLKMTVEHRIGYDRETGRLVLTDSRTTGTVNGDPFTVVMSQELVSDDSGPIGNGDGEENPKWLNELIQRLENEPPANPPMTITRYQSKGQTVYFQTAPCCDIFSNLYDADGTIIGHPDGGITGQGDGRVPDFFDERQNGRLVWEDKRKAVPDTTQVLAPIESVELNIAESFPLQYFLAVTSGLPNSCHTFGGYTVTRNGTDVRVRVFNLRPTDRGVVCAQVYGAVDTNIPLGSDFDPSTTYTVSVNGEVALEYTNDKVTSPLEKAQRELDKNRQIWRAHGLITYRMAFQWFCFCVPEYVEPVVVSVRDANIIDGVTFSETGKPVDPSSFDRYETVDGLFDLIQDAIDQDAFSISVEYDPDLGYPARASIDYHKLVIDEERGFRAEVIMKGS